LLFYNINPFKSLTKRYMNSYKLSFAEIIKLKNNLAEVIINEGVELDEIMVAEYHSFVTNLLSEPRYLLVNKKNSYSYNFNAQKTIINFDKIKAYGIVAPNAAAILGTKSLVSIGDNPKLNLQIFSTREEALGWLELF